MNREWIILGLALGAILLLRGKAAPKRVNVGRVESSTFGGATAADVLGYAQRRIQANEDPLTLSVRSRAEEEGAFIKDCDPNTGNCTTTNGWNLPRWYVEGILGLKGAP